LPDAPTSTHSPRNRYWLASQLQLTEQPKATYYQPASSEAADESSTCEVIQDFNSRIAMNGTPDMEILGSVLHHCFALVITKPDINVEILNELLTAKIPGVPTKQRQTLPVNSSQLRLVSPHRGFNRKFSNRRFQL